MYCTIVVVDTLSAQVREDVPSRSLLSILNKTTLFTLIHIIHQCGNKHRYCFKNDTQFNVHDDSFWEKDEVNWIP